LLSYMTINIMCLSMRIFASLEWHLTGHCPLSITLTLFMVQHLLIYASSIKWRKHSLNTCNCPPLTHSFYLMWTCVCCSCMVLVVNFLKSFNLCWMQQWKSHSIFPNFKVSQCTWLNKSGCLFICTSCIAQPPSFIQCYVTLPQSIYFSV
jgi:hypothetical protein